MTVRVGREFTITAYVLANWWLLNARDATWDNLRLALAKLNGLRKHVSEALSDSLLTLDQRAELLAYGLIYPKLFESLLSRSLDRSIIHDVRHLLSMTLAGSLHGVNRSKILSYLATAMGLDVVTRISSRERKFVADMPELAMRVLDEETVALQGQCLQSCDVPHMHSLSDL